MALGLADDDSMSGLEPQKAVDEILDDGFLVQQAGVNPETGEAWKPRWIPRSQCRPELVAKWKATRANVINDVKVKIQKRSLSPIPAGHLTVKKEDEFERISVKEEDFPDVSEDHYRQKRSRLDIPDTSSTTANKSSTNMPRGRTEQRSSIFLPKKAKGKITASRASSELNSMNIGNVSSEDHTKPFELERWLLYRAVSSKSGMIIVIRGTHGDEKHSGWFQGLNEGARGVILSVMNTGNDAFASTAETRLLSPLDPTQDTFNIPTQYIFPVEPSRPGQKALILHGDHKGEIAIVREEEENGWFVSVGNMHFEVSADKLVQVMDV
ncbi:hypothetical protein IEO21_01158 [Rhodonia placenta]|uniref:Uncharacterized protein n=1 Tax=Rhodonia placenta TaxID=104341 RepID=A0A8H7PA02_9APHY|nr:hypothetical protein IEO21_01158 [Postia placenta]